MLQEPHDPISTTSDDQVGPDLTSPPSPNRPTRPTSANPRRNEPHYFRGHLDDATWSITVDARPDLGARIKQLRTTRGYAFTHAASLKRVDNDEFPASDACSLLEDLFLFLTFIRGAPVGVALPVGSLSGRPTWRRWTSGLSAPYTNAFAWADPHAPQDLAALWPQFRAARRDPRWSNALLRAVRHYAEATQAVSTEVTLTLAQAALELIGTAICVDRDKLVAWSKWDRKSADWRIRRLLNGCVPTAIPKSSKALRAAAKFTDRAMGRRP